MTAVILTDQNICVLKRGLRALFPDVKSSYITEAFASAVGRRTHAALLADLKNSTHKDPEIILIDNRAFVAKLRSFGIKVDDEDAFIFEWMDTPTDKPILFETVPISAHKIEYRSQRSKAWRNIMVTAINAAIEQKLISLMPGDNRWPRAKETGPNGRGETVTYSFTFGDDIPALGYLSDAGWDELTVHAVLHPTENGESWVGVANAGFHAGEAFSSGWLERRSGFWLQSNPETLRCRRSLLEYVANIDLKPSGYGDRGKMIM